MKINWPVDQIRQYKHELVSWFILLIIGIGILFACCADLPKATAASNTSVNKCHLCNKTIKKYEGYTIHVEYGDEQITVLDDQRFCDKCGKKIAKAAKMGQYNTK